MQVHYLVDCAEMRSWASVEGDDIRRLGLVEKSCSKQVGLRFKARYGSN
jgi:hypothetical protein